MAKVPSLSGEKVVAQLKKHGFRVDRVNGSHHIMKNADGRGTTVPVHGGRDVAKGTLRSILSDVDLTPEELLNPKLVKAAEQLVDPREGVADARGATRRQSAAGRSGGRRKATSPARERDGRSRR
jgi:predicted RNA binding protein YcfA (HicA-like mRNA interferase family)